MSESIGGFLVERANAALPSLALKTETQLIEVFWDQISSRIDGSALATGTRRERLVSLVQEALRVAMLRGDEMAREVWSVLQEPESRTQAERLAVVSMFLAHAVFGTPFVEIAPLFSMAMFVISSMSQHR